MGILSGAISVGVYALIAPASSAIPSGQVQDAGNAISIAVFILGMMFGIVQFSVVAQVIKSGVATTVRKSVRGGGGIFGD